jgi:spermidine/putrescine transport system permease protein
VPPRAARRARRWPGRILPVYTWLVILYLVLPIMVMIAFGFNDTKSRLNLTWQGFTFHWYRDVFANPALSAAFRNTLLVAVLTTAVATTLGTMLGLALGRYRFRGQGGVDLLIFAAISCPELVLGTALLSLFITLQVPRGLLTILVAHIMFSVPFVAVTVRARMAGFDVSLEEAAQDLGADPWTTFRKVTLPLIFPGIMAGALLAFALSIDDYIITSFINGQTETFPIWVYGATRQGVPPQVNVLGTFLFLTGVGLAVANAVALRRRKL